MNLLGQISSLVRPPLGEQRRAWRQSWVTTPCAAARRRGAAAAARPLRRAAYPSAGVDALLLRPAAPNVHPAGHGHGQARRDHRVGRRAVGGQQHRRARGGLRGDGVRVRTGWACGWLQLGWGVANTASGRTRGQSRRGWVVTLCCARVSPQSSPLQRRSHGPARRAVRAPPVPCAQVHVERQADAGPVRGAAGVFRHDEQLQPAHAGLHHRVRRLLAHCASRARGYWW